jgi:hypothetical protein
MEMIIFVSLMSLIFGIVTIYLFNRQKNIAEHLKVGDKVSIDGLEGEIVEKGLDGKFIVKVEVSGMRISKRG